MSTLFDFEPVPRPLRVVGEPAARSSDPRTSHLAAAVAQAGNADLMDAIHRVVEAYSPIDAFAIAAAVEAFKPGRWQEDTIRAAVSHASKNGTLRAVDVVKRRKKIGGPQRSYLRFEIAR